MRNTCWIGLVAVLAAAGAWADREESHECLVVPEVTVRVENAAGQVEVVAWDRELVQLDASLGSGVAALHFTCADAQVQVRVEPKWRARNADARLRLRVPRGATLLVDTASADVDIRDVSGRKEVQTASGNIDLVADSSALRLRSVSGDIELTGHAPSMEVSTTSGEVRVEGGAERLRLATVSGDVEVKGRFFVVESTSVSGNVQFSGSIESLDASSVSGDLEVATVEAGPEAFPRVRVKSISGGMRVNGREVRDLGSDSVSGDFRFEGSFGSAPRVEVRSTSGNVDFLLHSALDAALRIATRSGRIESEVPDARPRKEPGAGSELLHEGGTGSLRVDTQSGNVRLLHP